MPLTSGARLGPYEIISALGAGGMGEVYRARDTRLNRTVAIKIVSPEIAGGPEARARFEREAQAISALNHPHICTLFDVGRADGVEYLVMEHLDGETLAARIEGLRAKGSGLPLDQVFRYAIEIADALDAAHRAGIVHRDLKPGNIILTRTGAKLLDFGLAKRQPTSGANAASLATMPTQAAPVTAEGTLVGTFNYMAPEVLAGKPADARSDLFAFGAIAYEMATGRKAFEGATVASVIAAILEREPVPLVTLQPVTPPSLEHLVRRALAKNPDERWQTARDVAEELKWIASSGPAEPAARAGRAEWRNVAIAVTLVAFAFVAGRLAAPRPRENAPHAVRFQLTPPKGLAFIYPAVSPDGRTVAIARTRSIGAGDLVVRRMDSDAFAIVPESRGAWRGFWSPDGRSLAFFVGDQIRCWTVDTADVRTIGEVAGAAGGAWQGATILVGSATGIWRLPAAGGPAIQLTHVDAAESGHGSPAFLPDGRHFLYSAHVPAPGSNALYVADLDRPQERQRLLDIDGDAAIADANHLLFRRGRQLFATRFDSTTFKVSGEPYVVVDRLFDNRRSQYSAAPNTLAYFEASAQVELQQLVEFDRAGSVVRKIGDPAAWGAPSMSPDGRRMALERGGVTDADRDVVVVDVATGLSTPLTRGAGYHIEPLWSRDGRSIVYVRGSNNAFQLTHLVLATGEESVLLNTRDMVQPDEWTSDGKTLIVERTAAEPRQNLLRLSIADGRFAPVSVPFRYVSQAQLSPDERWLAYTVIEPTQDSDVFIQPFAGGEAVRVSTAGGSSPRWSQSGRELFYVSADDVLMAVTIHREPAVSADPPRRLFPLPLGTNRDTRGDYIVLDDGRRFIAETAIEEESVRVTVITSWSPEPPK
jgi:hypothetical protein